MRFLTGRSALKEDQPIGSAAVWVAITLFAAAAVLAASGLSSTHAQERPVTLTIATVEPGSTWYAQGSTIAALVRPLLPPGSVVDVLPYAGGVANIQLLHNREVDLALTFNLNAKWGYEGTSGFDKQHDFLAIAGGLDQYYVGVVATRRSGITSLGEAFAAKRGIRLRTVPLGGGGEQTARQLLEAYGINYDTIRSWGGNVEHTSRNVITSDMRDGRADVFVHTITRGHPAVSEIASATDIRLVPLEEEIVQWLGRYGYGPAVIPAGSYRGQDEDVFTAGLSTALYARSDLPEWIAYVFAKALFENKPALVQGHASFEDFDPSRAGEPLNVGDVPLHPGAARYYRERGLQF